MKKYDGMRNDRYIQTNKSSALNTEIEKLESIGRAHLTDVELEHLLNMRDEIKTIERRVANLDNNSEEIDYFTDTSSILFKYYDIIENGASTLTQPDIVETQEVDVVVDSRDTDTSILKWFKTSNTKTPKVSTTNDRASLLDKYLTCTDTTHIRGSALAASNEEYNTCPHCKDASRTAMIHDGYVFCNNCFTVEYILVDHDKPSYKDPPKEITYFAYKRINHFNEWLNTVQGKETTLIPDEMFDKILLELKKLRITNLSELSNAKMKDILKKLRSEGGSRYYEHIPHIITKLNGLPTPHLPPELEERLRHMFCQIQVPFLKHACALNPSRKNFLSYSYVLNKFMQLLEKDQYIGSFPLLKSREKLHAQDNIWKKICEELGWQYYRSI
jgi:hypothetical protein